MSRRSRLPDSLMWRAVRWMEMELHLDISMCLTVWSSDSGININTKILCPEDMFHADHELQHLQKTVFSLFRPEVEEALLCRSSLQTTF
ncbi:hypothetical protein AVEN_155319-1 [Araneus ventricosus]|uniref:Uncharacterized protein n=1 Tax=Araneus ventricosus TaxID=182803 RepID=A0A4Y2BA00_ARAVE|nr:hypothetical protein AVEN_155319-1 [Araneus ventricosus]